MHIADVAKAMPIYYMVFLVIVFLGMGVIGGIGLLREGQTLSGIYEQLKNFRTRSDQA